MDRVLLYFSATPGIKVTVEIYFDEAENLVLEGYDIGKTVEEYWGDSDYEYTTTICPEEVKKLYKLFDLTPGEEKKLLSHLKSRFNSNRCYSELRELLIQNDIKFQSFSWM